jgi:hypothetical protein
VRAFLVVLSLASLLTGCAGCFIDAEAQLASEPATLWDCDPLLER